MSGSLVRRVMENHNIRTPALRSPTRAVRYVFSLLNTPRRSYTVPFGVMGHVSVKCFLARRVPTDQTRVEGVGASGGEPTSNAREGRSPHVNRHFDVELTRGKAT
jgi:hypothetical protein